MKWYAVAVVVGFLSATPALASCKVVQLVELPITIREHEALVDARFGSRNAQLIVDSGSATSALSAKAARDLNLPTTPAPFHMRGTGGSASASIARTNDFSLGGTVLPGMTFVVGGADFGVAGILGQDVLGIADADYDFPHGSVRLAKSDGCDTNALISSSGLSHAAVLPTEKLANGPYQPSFTVAVMVDGVSLRAKLDTGSVKTTMTLAAAKLLGITPKSPGVVETGYSIGVEGRHNPVWRASFQQMQIGNETVNKPTIYIQDMSQGVDMLLGFDFFTIHRVYISRRLHAAYVEPDRHN